MIDCPRKWSGSAPERLPTWCYTLEVVLGDTNIKLEYIVLNPRDTPYGQLYFDSGKETELAMQKHVSNDDEEDQTKNGEELDSSGDKSEEKTHSRVKKGYLSSPIKRERL